MADPKQQTPGLPEVDQQAPQVVQQTVQSVNEAVWGIQMLRHNTHFIRMAKGMSILEEAESR